MPTISTEIDHRSRQRDLIRDEQARQRELEEERKNKNFVQVYPLGWTQFRKLIDANPSAAKLFSFLAEHIDHTCGAVVVSQDYLAKKMDVNVRTIRRWLKALDDHKMIVQIGIQGGVHAYALDPLLVWKGFANGKSTAAFNTKTLVDRNGEVVKKLKVMMLEHQIDLPLESEED